jgi:hypothetical protein
MKAIFAAALILALPSVASAACGHMSASSAAQSCEQGVRVIRQAPLTPPRLSPAQVAQLELQRDQLALQRQQAQQNAALQSRRLDQTDRALWNQSYLYRDANSPLRQRAGGVYGFGGLNAGYTSPRIAVVGRVPVRRRRH